MLCSLCGQPPRPPANELILILGLLLAVAAAQPMPSADVELKRGESLLPPPLALSLSVLCSLLSLSFCSAAWGRACFWVRPSRPFGRPLDSRREERGRQHSQHSICTSGDSPSTYPASAWAGGGAGAGGAAGCQHAAAGGMRCCRASPPASDEQMQRAPAACLVARVNKQTHTHPIGATGRHALLSRAGPRGGRSRELLPRGGPASPSQLGYVPCRRVASRRVASRLVPAPEARYRAARSQRTPLRLHGRTRLSASRLPPSRERPAPPEMGP
ncbi:hypothetical protein JHW43_004815 [Diplocarpon mali]|nr:hypothetical protein JHW43_004815 [Diplocarpon mali]